MQDKNSAAAIAAVQAGVQAEPTSFLLHFALGYLYYLTNDQPHAAAEFEAAVSLNPTYADAKYFLGLSYFALGQKDKSLQQFADVQTLNPDNKEVAAIIENLKAGKTPFAGLLGGPAAPENPAVPASLNKQKAK
jgi:tetratricopeptide (TPR) repeat protein